MESYEILAEDRGLRLAVALRGEGVLQGDIARLRQAIEKLPFFQSA
ncbi:MAG: hypothetical protein LBC83_06710 [Oscillospiraceae bacterium]|nr:hypothetical protein [Oscillospiraceae bacterium]